MDLNVAKKFRAEIEHIVHRRSSACSCERSDAKKLPFVLNFCFSWDAEGALLRLRLVTASRPTYEASPSFASCYALATARSRPAPVCSAAASFARQKPPPTPLHVRGGDIALLCEQSVAGLNQI